jgi:hypothetical protein
MEGDLIYLLLAIGVLTLLLVGEHFFGDENE